MRCPSSCVVTGAGRIPAQLAMLPHNIAQQPGRLGRFETAVELNCCPDAAMAQKATDCLVIAWMMLQVDGGCDAFLQFLTEDHTVVGMTFQNWMPLAAGIVLIWIAALTSKL